MTKRRLIIIETLAISWLLLVGLFWWLTHPARSRIVTVAPTPDWFLTALGSSCVVDSQTHFEGTLPGALYLYVYPSLLEAGRCTLHDEEPQEAVGITPVRPVTPGMTIPLLVPPPIPAQQATAPTAIDAAFLSQPTCGLWLGDPAPDSPPLTAGETATWCDTEENARQWFVIRCHVDAGTALVRLTTVPLDQTGALWSSFADMHCLPVASGDETVTYSPPPAPHQLVVTIVETTGAPRMLHVAATRTLPREERTP